MTDIRPKETYRCGHCGEPKVDTYYAIDRFSEKRICDDCAHVNEVNTIKCGKRYTVYGPQDLRRGAKIVTWPGRELGTVLSVGGVHPWSKHSFWGEKHYCRLKMVDGSTWGGYIGEGVASNIKKLSSN